jgi:hypothetical protein
LSAKAQQRRQNHHGLKGSIKGLVPDPGIICHFEKYKVKGLMQYLNYLMPEAVGRRCSGSHSNFILPTQILFCQLVNAKRV